MQKNWKIALAATALVLAACSKKPDPKIAEAATQKASEALPVTVQPAELRRIDRVISVTGSLNPDETVTVNSEVIGRVTSIRFDFGQAVHKGDVLAEIDTQEYQIQLERSRAALAQALARLGMRPGDEETQPTTTAAMRQAEAQLEDAKFKYESAAKLVKTGDISQERFTELEKAYRAREAGFESSRDELRTQWASIASLRSDIQLAQKRLNDATMRAPFDGIVSQRQVSVGQYVKDNVAIMTLVKTNPMRLRVEVPETAAGVVRIGTLLTFTTDAIPGREFQAVVRQLNPSLDSKSRSLSAEARLTSTDPRLRPGMFAQVNLQLEREVNVVMVPKQAIYTIAGLNKMFIIRDGKAIELRVIPGIEQNGWVEVPSDIVHPSDRVAVSNLGTLVNGSPVTERKS
ncbi:MAG TPA: efflux RND transporter periplasmic adaptor subunit [Bryobacteraceae bacterium]|jgi:RND family efflux transporter MFP subunit